MNCVAAFQRMIEAGNRASVARGSINGGAAGLFELKDTIGVVGVVMGDQDVSQRPAALVQDLPDGGSVGRIDGGGLAGVTVVEQHAIIVGKDRELMNL